MGHTSLIMRQKIFITVLLCSISAFAQAQTLWGGSRILATQGDTSWITNMTGIRTFSLGNAFLQFTGPTTSIKTFTLPNASSTILTDNAAVTIAQGGTGQTTKAAAFDALSPMTTAGDLITGGASGTGTRLAMGTALQQIRVNAGGTALEYFTPSSGSGDISNGGNTTGAAITIGTNDAFGLNLETNNVTRFAITGAASTGGQVTQTAVTASTNVVTDLQTLRVNSTGTAADNFGGGLLFQGESSTTDNQDMGRISAYWTTATHASREAGFAFQLGNSAGAIANTMVLDRVNDSDGQLKVGASAPVLIDNDEITYDNDFSIKGSSFQNLSLLTTDGALYINGTSVSSGVGNPSTRVQINANSSGTPSTGFGPRILLTGESSTTNEQEMVGLRAAWTTATHATREARFTVQLGDAGGALTDVFEVNRSSDADGAILIGTGNTLLIDNDEMTAGVPFTISGGTNAITIGGSSGNTVIGGTAGSGTIQLYSTTGNISSIRETSTTNSTIGIGVIARSSGTPAAGFGSRIDFSNESTTTVDRDAGRIEAAWTTATDATRTSDLVFSTVNSATLAEAFRVYGNKRAMVGGGTNQASAALQVTSTTGGFLPPKMTDAQMAAISSPTEGLLVENTTVGGLCWYSGANWERLSTNVSPSISAGTGAGSGASASISGSDLAGVITITAGTSASTSATVATITFNTAFKTAPRAIIIAEANENAFAVRTTGIAGRSWYVPSADIAAGSFIIKSGSASNLAANGTEYKFFYHVIN